MKDQDRSKAELIGVLADLRQRVKELEAIEGKYIELKERAEPLGITAPDPGGPESRETAISEDDSARPTILVVDDNDTFREFIINALKSYGYQVLSASGSAEALHVLQQANGAVRLLIIDVVMPDGGGSELAQKVTAIYPEAKVVFMSGYTDEILVHSDVQEVIESNTAFIQKPFLTEDLLKMVREELSESDS